VNHPEFREAAYMSAWRGGVLPSLSPQVLCETSSLAVGSGDRFLCSVGFDSIADRLELRSLDPRGFAADALLDAAGAAPLERHPFNLKRKL